MPQVAPSAPQERLGARVATQLTWETAQGGQLAPAAGLWSQGMPAPRHSAEACREIRSVIIKVAAAECSTTQCQILAAQLVFRVHNCVSLTSALPSLTDSIDNVVCTIWRHHQEGCICD